MATATTCPHCGHEAGSPGANFCQRCGGALRGPPCAKCNAASEAGDRFCNQCGAALPQPGKGTGLSSISPAWAVAAVLFLALAVVLLTREPGGRELTLSPPPAGATTPGGAPPDLSSMTPREAADRLFRRVMEAVQQGNQDEVDQFMPMAVAAYERIGALTLDDRFHLSLLHAAAGNGAEALAVAEDGLDQRPTHILLLAAAAEAALLIGDEGTARRHYQTLVDSFDEEASAGLPEYAPDAHEGDLMKTLREEAAAYLAGPGS